MHPEDEDHRLRRSRLPHVRDAAGGDPGGLSLPGGGGHSRQSGSRSRHRAQIRGRALSLRLLFDQNPSSRLVRLLVGSLQPIRYHARRWRCVSMRTRIPVNRISTSIRLRRKWWTFSVTRARIVRDRKARESPSVGHERASTCGLFMSQIPNRAVLS